MSKSQPFPMYFDVPWVCRFGVPGILFICGCLASIMLLMAADDSVISVQWLTNFIWTTTAVITILIVSSYVIPKAILRIRHFYLLGGIATFAVVASCSSISLPYLIAKPSTSNFVLISTASTVWLLQIYVDAIRRVKNKRLIEKNYEEHDDHFMLKRPINEFNGDVHLSLRQHAVKNWIYVFIVCWSAYEFFITDFKASLPLDLFKYWLLASFGLIMTAYAAARLVQGFYLWFYIIWKLERKTGKKFLFPDPEQHQINGIN